MATDEPRTAGDNDPLTGSLDTYGDPFWPFGDLGNRRAVIVRREVRVRVVVLGGEGGRGVGSRG